MILPELGLRLSSGHDLGAALAKAQQNDAINNIKVNPKNIKTMEWYAMKRMNAAGAPSPPNQEKDELNDHLSLLDPLLQEGAAKDRKLATVIAVLFQCLGKCFRAINVNY